MPTVKLSDDLVGKAKIAAHVAHRSIPKQIEHWAILGRTAEENPDLPIDFIAGTLEALREVEAGDVAPFEFD